MLKWETTPSNKRKCLGHFTRLLSFLIMYKSKRVRAGFKNSCSQQFSSRIFLSKNSYSTFKIFDFSDLFLCLSIINFSSFGLMYPNSRTLERNIWILRLRNWKNIENQITYVTGLKRDLKDLCGVLNIFHLCIFTATSCNAENLKQSCTSFIKSTHCCKILC